MNKNFFDLPQETQRAMLEGAENKLNIRAIILEKDIWLCWVLQQLFTLPLLMAFKGGTSLSKVYNLIERFSEDVDITIDYTNFIDADVLRNATSRTALAKLSERLKNDLQQCVHQVILPHIHLCLNRDFPRRK
jgi:predicted nucleotidyltransferase component of viral defense system